MVQKRHTTDLLFFLLIFAMWIAMSVVGGIAVRDGDPYRLIAPIDDTGSMCGISPSVKSMAKFYTITAAGKITRVNVSYVFDGILSNRNCPNHHF